MWDVVIGSGLENFTPLPVKPYTNTDQPIENNLSKIGSSIPFFSAVSAIQGINAYTGKPIVYGNDPVYLQGRDSERVEPIMKSLADFTGGSPARLQKAIESYVTTPNTNPFVGVAYESLNLFSKYNKDSDMTSVISSFPEGFARRLKKEGFEYNILAKLDKAPSSEDIEAEKAAMDFEKEVIGNWIKYYENENVGFAKFQDKIIEAAETYQEAVPEMDNNMIQSKLDKFAKRAENKKEKVNPTVWKIAFQPSDRLAAKALYDVFGNEVTEENFKKWSKIKENQKLWNELWDAGAINEDILKLYEYRVKVIK